MDIAADALTDVFSVEFSTDVRRKAANRIRHRSSRVDGTGNCMAPESYLSFDGAQGVSANLTRHRRRESGIGAWARAVCHQDRGEDEMNEPKVDRSKEPPHGHRDRGISREAPHRDDDKNLSKRSHDPDSERLEADETFRPDRDGDGF